MTNKTSSPITKRLGIFYHEDFVDYKIPPGVFDGMESPFLAHQMDQPESPERIANTKAIFEKSELSEYIDWLSPQPASDEAILRFHSQQYLDRLENAQGKAHHFTQSTYMTEGGMSVIRLSAGAAVDAANYVVSGNGQLGYAISRPPSHHAQPDEADGYCFINGVGLAAHVALDSGCEKVAIIDWDVHHGNGTQAGFYDREDVLTISMHMDHRDWGETHLQTGDVDEIGTGPGKGFNVNLPLPFGSGDYCYTKLFERYIAPLVEKFNPDMIVLANGQDANQFDPNGRQCLTMAGYYCLASQLSDLAEKTCNGKVIMTQEGGYNPTYAPYCAYAVAAGLMNHEMQIKDPIAFYPDDSIRAEQDIQRLVERHPLLV